MKPKIATGFNVTDIEDALLHGQEEFYQVMAAVQAEFMAPLMEQAAAMQLSQMTPDQVAQLKQQMEAQYGTGKR